ncbi:ABC transporter permease [Arcanobacterium phocae]|uniref:ABC transporter permease n=1 Tax=Arcanobacterium phocae TaxID=131112 RepID=UPI001C0F0AB9|nr:ABC transporter permease [Arcanobacterium phocae]
MNATLIRSDVLRFLRAPEALFFTIGLPILMYIIFGGTAEYGEMPIGHGNINMAVLINMSIYAVAQAAVGYTGTAAVDRLQGWGRQLALTPLTAGNIIVNRILSAFLISTITFASLLIVGIPMGAQLPTLRLLAVWGISYLSVLLFACYGLAVAYSFKAETAVSISSGLLVLFSFAGNLFAPLSGTLLSVARFTPMWGVGELARYPLTEGQMYDANGALYSTPIWYALANIVAWLAIFSVFAVLAARRNQER